MPLFTDFNPDFGYIGSDYYEQQSGKCYFSKKNVFLEPGQSYIQNADVPPGENKYQADDMRHQIFFNFFKHS